MTGERWKAAVAVVSTGDLEALTRLLDMAPELVDEADPAGTLLHVAARSDDPAIAALLLDRGADPRARAPWGQTAFEWAANLGSERVAELLETRVGHALDLWTASALGRLPEVKAFFAGDRLLPSSGRTPHEGADLTGSPPDTPYLRGDALSDAFHIACRNGKLSIARFLRERGADIDATGYFGATALHWAAIGGHEETALWLVTEGADVGRRDPEFDAPASGWAREGGHDDLAVRLEAEAAAGTRSRQT